MGQQVMNGKWLRYGQREIDSVCACVLCTGASVYVFVGVRRWRERVDALAEHYLVSMQTFLGSRWPARPPFGPSERHAIHVDPSSWFHA